jgi:hypothetical protein
MALSVEKMRLLRAAYLDGSTMREAAGAAKVSPQTAWRKFCAFRAEGLPRGLRASKAKPAEKCARFARWGLPRYTGPDWIG